MPPCSRRRSPRLRSRRTRPTSPKPLRTRCGDDQRAAPEQHVLRHRAGRRHGECAQHPAGDPDRSRAGQPNQSHDFLADLPARPHRRPAGAAGRDLRRLDFGLGDINYTGWLSPAGGGPITWGIGPSISFPSATDEKLGTEKWSAGPAAVMVAQPGPLVLGGLVQPWSFVRDDDRQDVSQMLIQPFVNTTCPMAASWSRRR